VAEISYMMVGYRLRDHLDMVRYVKFMVLFISLTKWQVDEMTYHLE